MVYEFCFDNASDNEVIELLYAIASELGVQRNNSLSLIEKYACEANEGLVLVDDALRLIDKQAMIARRYDKAVDLIIDAGNVIGGCL